MNYFPVKILLATDGSADATLAAQAAVDLATQTASELHVVHVGLLSPWVHPDTLSASQYKRLKAEAQKVLDKQVEYITSIGGTIAEAHLKMGRADAETISLSEEIGAGLIVVGSRGVNTIERILIGSNGESIVRYAPCPVLVVRRQG